MSGHVDPVTVAMAFVRMPSAESAQMSGKSGEELTVSYYRCMVSAYGSVRRWNPDVDLVLVTADPVPEPYAGQLTRIGVETVLAPFAHRPPQGLGRGWVSSLYHLDAMEALCGRAGTQVFIEPDLLCVRPLDDLLETVGERVGAHFEQAIMTPESRGWKSYWELCEEMHLELGEPTAGHQPYIGSFYVVPQRWAPVLLERNRQAWQLSLERHVHGKPGFSRDEHFMNYALRGVPVVEMSSHVRVIPTVPWRRNPVDGETLRGLTLWNLMFEKDRGFQRMYQDAVDPESWFWTAPPAEFRQRAGAMMSATRRPPQYSVVAAVVALLRRITTERTQRRMRSLYRRCVQISASVATGDGTST